jgi:hypothetical protein
MAVSRLYLSCIKGLIYKYYSRSFAIHGLQDWAHLNWRESSYYGHRHAMRILGTKCWCAKSAFSLHSWTWAISYNMGHFHCYFITSGVSCSMEMQIVSWDLAETLLRHCQIGCACKCVFQLLWMVESCGMMMILPIVGPQCLSNVIQVQYGWRRLNIISVKSCLPLIQPMQLMCYYLPKGHFDPLVDCD